MDDHSHIWRKEYLSKLPTVIGGFFLLLLLAECGMNIVLRYLRMPIAASYDFLSLFGVFMIAPCLIITESSGGHVLISIFTFGASKNRKIGIVIDTIIKLITLSSVLLIAYAIFVHLAKVSLPNHELAMTMEIPCAIFRAAWGVGWILLFGAILVNLCYSLKKERTK